MRRYLQLGIFFFLAIAILSCTYKAFPPPARAESTFWRAPVKCGPYYLYIHPSQATSPAWARTQRYKIFSVSTTPPDEKTDTIEQIWAYGVAQHMIDMKRPTLFHAETHRRESVRPAIVQETAGDYIGEYYCKPYKPSELQCYGGPWCGTPR